LGISERVKWFSATLFTNRVLVLTSSLEVLTAPVYRSIDLGHKQKEITIAIAKAKAFYQRRC